VEQEKACLDTARRAVGDRGEPGAVDPPAVREYPLPDTLADRLVVAVRAL